MPHISLAAETLWTIAGFPITNSLLTGWLVMAILLIWAFLSTRKLTMIPSKAQLIAEIIVGGLHDMFSAVCGKYIKYAFPLLASLFLYIIIGNWVGLLPGVGTIGFTHTAEESHGEVIHEDNQEESDHESAAIDQGEHDEAVDDSHSQDSEESHEEVMEDTHSEEGDTDEADHDGEKMMAATDPSQGGGDHGGEEEHHSAFTPLFRGVTADLNTTLALAIVAVVAIQLYGFQAAGVHYSGRFFDLSNPINFFVGILEIISDASKVMSFAFRLFGNIFAGEVLLAVIAFLIPFIVPLPFLMLELFVGFVQALVFSMLTAVFINVSLAHGEHIAHEAHGHKDGHTH